MQFPATNTVKGGFYLERTLLAHLLANFAAIPQHRIQQLYALIKRPGIFSLFCHRPQQRPQQRPLPQDQAAAGAAPAAGGAPTAGGAPAAGPAAAPAAPPPISAPQSKAQRATRINVAYAFMQKNPVAPLNENEDLSTFLRTIANEFKFCNGHNLLHYTWTWPHVREAEEELWCQAGTDYRLRENMVHSMLRTKPCLLRPMLLE